MSPPFVVASSCQKPVGEPAAVAVYERAVVPCAYSVEMWTLYCAHAARHWADEPERVRGLFERALQYVGSDYAADGIWDKYIAYESAVAEAAAADMGRVSALYARVLALPLRLHDVYWARFAEFAATRTASELLAAESEVRADRVRHLTPLCSAVARDWPFGHRHGASSRGAEHTCAIGRAGELPHAAGRAPCHH